MQIPGRILDGELDGVHDVGLLQGHRIRELSVTAREMKADESHRPN